MTEQSSSWSVLLTVQALIVLTLIEILTEKSLKHFLPLKDSFHGIIILIRIFAAKY